MPMPEFDPRDYEFMNHPPGTKPYGEHPDRERDQCGERTKQHHNHPNWGPHLRWVCTRERGHMGRHEAGMGPGEIAASWVDKPAE